MVFIMNILVKKINFCVLFLFCFLFFFAVEYVLLQWIIVKSTALVIQINQFYIYFIAVIVCLDGEVAYGK